MSWDYIIVGAGSAGCALTYELIRAGRTVLVIEAGGSDRSPFIKVPVGAVHMPSKYDWGYQAQPDSSRNGVKQVWSRGKVLGGSSSVNGTIYVRGAAEDYDRWSAQCGGAGGWSAREIMPIFRELETSDQLNPLRGRTGPVYTRTVTRPHPISQAFVSAACASDYQFNADYNGNSQEGFSYIQYTQRRGWRWSAADAFVRPLLGRKNLKLMLNASVDKIEMSARRATAVILNQGGRQHRETAGNVIVCGGAINSPKLLMLSGIGEAKELKRHRIDVVEDLPGVGQNLQDHPLLYLAYRTRVPTYNPTEGWRQKLRIAAEFAIHGQGPISNLFDGLAFLKSSSTKVMPDLQLFFASAGYLRAHDGEVKLASFPSVTLCVANSYPTSRGCVRLASNRADDPPLIEFGLLRDAADVETMVHAVRKIRAIMNTEPMAHMVEGEVIPGKQTEALTDLEQFVRTDTSICFHSIGTCRMGKSADSVVGPDLRVHGTDNLWIADASIVPSPISANMNGPCMMIGMKLGKQLVAEGR